MFLLLYWRFCYRRSDPHGVAAHAVRHVDVVHTRMVDGILFLVYAMDVMELIAAMAITWFVRASLYQTKFTMHTCTFPNKND